MDRLVSADTVRTRMGLALNEVGNEDFIESAIMASQLHIASVIGTKLDKVEAKVDRFYADPNAHMGIQQGGAFKLRLNRGFLLAQPTLTYGDAWNTPSVDRIAIDAEDFLVDLEQGVIHLDATHESRYIWVTYDAGFEGGDELPDWLKETIIAYAPVVFNFGATTNRKEEAKPNYQASGDHALAVAALHLRSQVLIIRPLNRD